MDNQEAENGALSEKDDLANHVARQYSRVLVKEGPCRDFPIFAPMPATGRCAYCRISTAAEPSRPRRRVVGITRSCESRIASVRR